MTKTVMVTGASGLVGRAVVERLYSEKYRVICVGRSPASCDHYWLHLDLGVASIPANVLDNVEVIIHLAAAVPHAVEYPDNEHTASLTENMDQAVFSVAQKAGLPVIYASGCSLYNRLSTSWKTERSTVSAISPYLRAKLRGEKLFLDNLPQALIMRLSAPFGSGLRKNLVLARFAEAAMNDQSIQVWGNGTREQDFIHTEDVADFVVKVLKKQQYGIWNVAAGKPTTMLELANICVNVIRKGRVQLNGQPDPSDDQTARYSIAAAKHDFQWQPQRTLQDWLSHLNIGDLQ